MCMDEAVDRWIDGREQRDEASPGHWPVRRRLPRAAEGHWLHLCFGRGQSMGKEGRNPPPVFPVELWSQRPGVRRARRQQRWAAPAAG